MWKNPKIFLFSLYLLFKISPCVKESSGLPQMHMLSLKMENNLHKNCPKNCRDVLQWLPENVVYQILDQLDPCEI